MSLLLNQVGDEERKFTSERNNYKGGEICGDFLEEEILHQSKSSEQVLLTEYMIFASVFGGENWSEGYCWFHSHLKCTHECLANQIEMEKAVNHLKRKYFDYAINILKGFNKK